MNAFTFIALFALVASAAYAEDSQTPKKQDKRGVLGLGYGGYAGHGLSGGLALGGYGYTGHGYVAAPSYTLDHAVAAPVAVSHGLHSISSGPVLSSAPVRVAGYEHGLGYSGLGLGHGLAYGHGW